MKALVLVGADMVEVCEAGRVSSLLAGRPES
jgi:hypothetical protein